MEGDRSAGRRHGAGLRLSRRAGKLDIQSPGELHGCHHGRLPRPGVYRYRDADGAAHHEGGGQCAAQVPIQGALVSVDYDFVVLNDHDYMLPISAQVILKKGRKELDKNEIEFRNFRRFGSDTRILNDGSVAKP